MQIKHIRFPKQGEWPRLPGQPDPRQQK